MFLKDKIVFSFVVLNARFLIFCTLFFCRRKRKEIFTLFVYRRKRNGIFTLLFYRIKRKGIFNFLFTVENVREFFTLFHLKLWTPNHEPMDHHKKKQ